LKRAFGDAVAGGATSNALQPFLRSESPQVLTAAWRLARALHLPESPAQRDVLSLAMKRAKDRAAAIDQRVEQIRLLAFGDYATVGDTLVGLLVDSEPAGIQTAAVAALSEHTDSGLARRLLDRWRSLQPSVRPQVLALLLQRVIFHDALLSALESGRVTLGELNLDLEQRRRLLRKSSSAVMARAVKWIGDGEYSNRKELVDEWLKKLPAAGSADRGQQTFVRLCASCHSPLGNERSVGPDLASVAHRSVEDLVSNILDPNMAINPNYVSYTVETKDGEIFTGVLQSESPENVVLLQAMGKRSVIQRKDIHEMRSTGLSLMPEGLETGLDPAGLRDLVAYLQSLR
jgi:putative heme-binding domain-containing protein